jgi:hypothetical protein
MVFICPPPTPCTKLTMCAKQPAEDKKKKKTKKEGEKAGK